MGGHTLLVGELEDIDNSPTSSAVRPRIEIDEKYNCNEMELTAILPTETEQDDVINYEKVDVEMDPHGVGESALTLQN